MKFRPQMVVFAAFALLGSTALSREMASPEVLTKKINGQVKGFLERKEMAGAVTLVAKDGKIIHHEAHGLADIESEREVEKDSVFRIHSMSKAITTAAALMLWEEGKFELNDQVAEWVPAFRDKEGFKDITVRDLMRHTSGLTYDFTGGPKIKAAHRKADLWNGDLERFSERVTMIPLAHAPNEKWTYGVSTDLLGHLVEVWSGQRLDDFMLERIFEPLGMKDTGFHLPESKRERLASLYQRTLLGGLKPATPFLGYDKFERPPLCAGGAGLVSTAEDYFQFLQMVLDGGERKGKRFLKPETIKLMTTNQLPEPIENISFGPEQRTGIGFGLGFNVVTREKGPWAPDALLGEFGWGGAASCHYWVLPSDRIVVITLEQTFPYGWSLEKELKETIYDSFGAGESK